MRPIFEPERLFLQETLNIQLPPNTCWMNKLQIVVYTNAAQTNSLGKVTVKGTSLSYKSTSNNSLKQPLTHQELTNLHNKQLSQIEEESLNVVRETLAKYPNHSIRICSSEGKDSLITKYIVRKVIPNAKVLFSNTSLDTAQTYKSIKRDSNYEIVNPPEGFYQWRERINFIPSKMGRACCTMFKEGAMSDVLDKTQPYLFFYGMRNQEGHTRKDYQNEWCNEKWSTDKWVGALPIRKWSELDVWLYIFREKLDFNELYTYGYGRVGCIAACPFRTPYEGVIDKEFLPTQYTRWQRILRDDFIDNGKWTLLNCTLQEYLDGAWKAGIVRDEPTQDVIEEFAIHKGLDLEIAQRYFNQACNSCGKRLKKDESGLSMKYFGRSTSVKYCIRCLSKELKCTREKLRQDVRDFKSQGCALF